MKGLFLDSRVGLRILVMFVLAAGLPMLLLATLSQRTVDTALNQSALALMGNSAKLAGVQTIERLRVAQAALRVDHTPPAAVAMPGSTTPLLAVVDVSRDGSRVVRQGAEHALVLLSAALEPSMSLHRARLQVVDGPAPDLRSVLLLMPEDAAGIRRIGLVSPAFLWADMTEADTGLWLCALDSQARPLFCSDSAAPDAAARWIGRQRQGHETRPAHAVKGLFLGADFDAPDWHFVVAPEAAWSDGQADLVSHVLPVAAAAGLLIAVLLSMIQIRRTMTPLGRLATGARAIARGHFATRLDIRTRDEFGDLAIAFNEMAGTLEGQFAELAAFAEIDRDIVEHGGIDRVLALVAQRLARLMPNRPIAIAHMTADLPTAATCRVVDPQRGLQPSLDVTIDPAGYATLTAAADWLHYGRHGNLPDFAGLVAIQGFSHAIALPLRWRERCFGFVAVGQRAPDDIDADTMRQVVELRNRAAVAAGAAEREQALLHDARYDSMTGLLNRQGLHEHLQRFIADAGPALRTLAVLFVDLDRFKAVNDGLGHAAGDHALRVAAERLRACLPVGSVAARPAGDEFIVVLPNAGAQDSATALAGTLCSSLAVTMLVDNTPVCLGASVGVVLCTDPNTQSATLLRQADQAMYEAKRRGGGRYAMFDSQLDAQAQRRAWIERELPLAAAAGQLRLFYQPRVETTSGRTSSVEALVRWQHPDGGAVSPAEFIPIAEDSDLIEHLGRWIMDEACGQVRALRVHGIADVRIAINLSARQIASERLVHDLRSAMERHGIRATDLEIEITEGLLVEHRESTVARLHELRSLGITIALDDFGTGYSSMSYLRRLPIDVVKVDRSFVKDLGVDRTAVAVAHAIVALARSLGMRTVAEGVETPAQLRALEELHCDELQGFLFSPAVDAQTLREILLADEPGWAATLAAATSVQTHGYNGGGFQESACGPPHAAEGANSHERSGPVLKSVTAESGE